MIEILGVHVDSEGRRHVQVAVLYYQRVRLIAESLGCELVSIAAFVFFRTRLSVCVCVCPPKN